MEQSHEELSDIMARQLIKQAEVDFDDGKVEEEKTETTVKRGGDAATVEVTTSPQTDEKENDHELAHSDQALPSTFTKVEKSLASLGFFTPSSKRLKNQKTKSIGFTREIDGKRVEVTAEIVPSVKFGLPVTADQDKYLALQTIITSALATDGEIKNPVKFRSADLLRLLGSTDAGKNYNDISEWLAVMMSTTIFSQGVVYKASEKRYVKDIFHVFDRVVSVGKEMPDGTIADANYVWLSDWQLQNINNKYLLPIDLETYRGLKHHIAKALVPLLQVWLFAQKTGSFEKRYDALCEILTLRPYSAPSQIERQLRPSFDELKSCGYLEKWRIEKTADRKAYKIIFFPGPKFYRDRRRRLEQKIQAEQPIIIAQSETFEPELPQPGKLEPEPSPLKAPQKLAETVLQNNTSDAPGQPPADHQPDDRDSKLVDELSIRGIMPSAAMKLLKSLPPERLDQVGDYIDYWDVVKKSKAVGEGFLISLIREGNPLPANFETRRRQEARQATEQRREKLVMIHEALTDEYEEYRQAAITLFISESVSAEEYERRVAVQAKEQSRQGGLWNEWMKPEDRNRLAHREVRAQIAQGMSFLSFEDFRKRDLARILAKFNLDPATLGIELPIQTSTDSQTPPETVYTPPGESFPSTDKEVVNSDQEPY